jgi:hypothetical protein
MAFAALDAAVLIDRFCGDFGTMSSDLALTAADFDYDDPSKFKSIFEVPRSFDDAWNHSDQFQRTRWRDAICNEFKKMNDKQVWRKVKRSTMPRDRRCVKHKWVFEIKRDGRFRARLVACGYSQIAGVDFTEVFSPVANDVTFRVLLLYMIINKLSALIFDVETAFLNGVLEETIYMDCPEGMPHDKDECLLLEKTIYGLVQSARMYYLKYKEILSKMGFKACPSDPCLFMRENQDGVCFILCYVDDNLTVGTPKAIKAVVEEIKQYGLSVTVENELSDYLSCEIVLSKDRSKAWLGQPHMIKKIKKTFGDAVKGLPVYKTPGTPGQGLILEKNEEDKVSKEKQSLYRTGVGMLLYLIKHSRPELSNPVRELSKCLSGPNEAAYKEMLRVIKYTLDTPNRGLKIEPRVENNMWSILLFTDSDWAGDKDSRKSITGFMLFLNGVLVSWRSKAQQAVALSSSEAEYYALSEAVKEIPFIVQLLLFMKIKVELPVKVLVDNMGAIYMSENAASSARTRHMDMRVKYVNSLQEDGMLKVEFVPSKGNRSDIATKNTQGDIYSMHLEHLVSNREDVQD